MYDMVFIWILLFAAVGADQTLGNSEECEVMTPDPRAKPGSMNQTPGLYLNLFPDLTTPRSGRIKKITYYAIREGKFYISFWKPLGNHMFELVTKLQATSEGEGIQANDPESCYVEKGNILAIHYSTEAAAGVVVYENRQIPERNEEIPMYNLYNINLQDDGWLNGMVLNITGAYFNRIRNVALHIKICECVNNTFGGDCEPCSDNCLGNTCNKITGVCDQGCQEGFQGPQCNLGKEVKDESNTGLLVGLGVVVLIALVLAGSTTVLAVILQRTRESNDMRSAVDMQSLNIDLDNIAISTQDIARDT